MFGYYGRVSKVRTLEFRADHSPVVELGLVWAEDFLPASCEEYERLFKREDDDDSLIPTMRRGTFALNATVLRVLAACFQAWREEVGEDVEPLTNFIRSQSFKNTLANSLPVRAGLAAPGTNSPFSRRQEVQKAIRYIVQQAKDYAATTAATTT